MGAALAKMVEKDKREQQPQSKPSHDSPKEKAALQKLRAGAKAAGSYLASGGRGGLAPSLALGVFKRAQYRCEYRVNEGDEPCGNLGTKKNPLTLHHLGGIAKTPLLSKMGHENTKKNVIAICESCHDRAHEKARQRGDDSSQVTPAGDEGNPRRDHGKPAAKPGFKN